MVKNKTAIILGSGLHQIVNDMVVEEERSYDEIKDFKLFAVWVARIGMKVEILMNF